MKYHPLVEKITGLLKEKGVWFETFEHEPVRTSEEAAKIRSGYTLKQGAKAILIRAKEGGKKYFVMIVIPGDRRFSNDKVKRLLNAKDIRFASEEEIKKITQGVVSGGIPPFGNFFGLKTIVDFKLFQNEKIVFNAGDRRFSVAMKSKDYQNIAEPITKDVVQ